MSIYLFNRIMKPIPGTRVKKGCCILTILYDGFSFLYKYPTGSLLSPSSSNFKCPITMMRNTNSSHTKVGLIAAICSDNPSKVGSDTIKHDIILRQGVAFEPDLQDIVFIYYEWRKEVENSKLYELLTLSVPNASIVDCLFEPEPSTMRLVKCSKYIMYFNQIAGPKHHSFATLIMLSPHKSGEMIYESALTPERWGKNYYYDPTIKVNSRFLGSN